MVITVGTRANWLNGHLRPPRFGKDARFVVANIDPDEIGRGRVPVVGVMADARVFFDQVADRLAAAGGISDAVPIDPLRFCEEVRLALPRDAVLIVDGHETLEFARRWIPSLSEANYLTSGPNGCMGVGVPFALGAAVARPDRPVFVLMGDGGFGGHGEFVERPEEIAPALRRAIESGRPALVNVCVDPDAQAAGGSSERSAPKWLADDRSRDLGAPMTHAPARTGI